MADGEPGGSAGLTAAVVLIAGLLLCFLVAGAVSAMVTMLRMRQEGLINGDIDSTPGGRLLHKPRAVLLTLSVSYVAAVAASATALPALVAALSFTPSTPAWIATWLAYVLVLLGGTLLTKALALTRPVGFTRSIAPLIWVAFLLLRPLTALMEAMASRLAPSVLALDLSPPFSGHEFRGILADEESAALLEEQERDWVQSIFDLRDTEVREIMVPRIDMVGLEVDTPFEEAIRMASGTTFTRLPVWQESQDRILGILHVRDLLAALARGERPTVRGLLRPVEFVPESKNVGEALRELRTRQVHLAVVVDEYGGTAGIVSLEDILEEIVGEIRDEFDEEGELIRVIDPRRAIIDPRIDLDDLNERLELTLPVDESDTLGGLLYSLCGRVPTRGDQVEFEGLRFTIDRVERQRIRQVTLTSPGNLPAENGDHGTGSPE